jgi:hypothetical protein
MTARARRSRSAGGIVGATWLIGLGVLFLLQQTLDWSWGQAWPMFIILAGVGVLASLLVDAGHRRRWFTPLAWPLFLIVVGVLLLLSTTGQLGVEPADLVTRWWPAAVIALGIWFLVGAILPARKAGDDHLELPLGGAGTAEVTLRFGGGELTIGRGKPGTLVDADFEGMPGRHELGGPGSVVLEPDEPYAWPWWDRTPHWRVGVTGEVPLDLRIDSGAARGRYDLGDVLLRSLTIKTGASDTRVTLPRAAGATRVRAESGAASLTFEVPQGVAARIRGSMALGSTRVDESRFPRGGGGWESPGYEQAPNRIELEVSGGVGSVDVR